MERAVGAVEELGLDRAAGGRQQLGDGDVIPTGELVMLRAVHGPAEGAVLIDTLPENEYAEEHIVGAVNIPQKQLTPQGTAHLAKDAPLIVYCYDLD